MFESYQQQRTHRSVSVGAHLGKRVVSEMEFCDPATSLSGCHALCVCPHCCATPMHTTDTSPETGHLSVASLLGFPSNVTDLQGQDRERRDCPSAQNLGPHFFSLFGPNLLLIL